jgi:hypothetical protein
MGAYASLQSLITVTGDTSSDDVVEIQTMDDWLDLLNYADAIITVHTKTVSLTGSDTADIALSTTDTKRAGSFDAAPDGPRWDAYTETGVSSDQWYKTALTLEQDTVTASTKPIDRWLCWLLTVNKVTGGPFSVTFEIFVTAKVAA